MPARPPALLPSQEVDTHVLQPTAQVLSHLGTMLADGFVLGQCDGSGWSQGLQHFLALVLQVQLAALRVTCVRGSGTTAQSQRGLRGVSGVWE